MKKLKKALAIGVLVGLGLFFLAGLVFATVIQIKRDPELMIAACIVTGAIIAIVLLCAWAVRTLVE